MSAKLDDNKVICSILWNIVCSKLAYHKVISACGKASEISVRKY